MCGCGWRCEEKKKNKLSNVEQRQSRGNQNEENIKVEETEYQNDLSHIKNKLSLPSLLSANLFASYHLIRSSSLHTR